MAILRAVSSAVFLLCLFLFLSSLPWPGLRWWFASVFFASLLPYFPGSSCCCLPLWVVRFLAFLSGTVIVRGARSLYPLLPCVRSWGRLILPSGCFSSTLLVLFLFSYSCYFSSLSYACSFVSPRALSCPLSPPAILFLVRGFFSHSFLLCWVLLCLRSPRPLLLFAFWSSFLGSFVVGFGGLYLVFFLCLAFSFFFFFFL